MKEIPTKILSDGVEIPLIGLGTYLLENEICRLVVKKALDKGYRLIDTAEQYGNQKEIGRAIQGFPRKELFLVTKLQWDFLDPKLVEKRCDLCLSELGVDYLDLYLIHWPNKNKPLSEIVAAMHRLKEKGKVRSVGISNFTIHHLQDLLDDGLSVSVNQIEYHPYLNQSKILDFCKTHKISVIGYSPLGRGEILDDALLMELAEKYQVTSAQICLRWGLQKGLIVIPMSHTDKYLEENLHIFDFALSEKDIEKIDFLDGMKRKRMIKPEINEFDY